MEMPPWWKSVALATCLLAAIISSAQAASNEIKNGEFDQGMANWEGETQMAGATKTSNRKAFTVAGDGMVGPGLKVLEVTLDPKEVSTLSQKFRASTKFDYFDVSFRYKLNSDAQPPNPGTMQVVVDGATHPTRMWPRFIPGKEWQTFTSRFSNQIGKPKNLKIMFFAGSGKVLLDDVTIVCGP